MQIPLFAPRRDVPANTRPAHARGREIAALLLWIGALFLGLGLASLDGGDWVGPVGTAFAHGLVSCVGVIAWALPGQRALEAWRAARELELEEKEKARLAALPKVAPTKEDEALVAVSEPEPDKEEELGGVRRSARGAGDRSAQDPDRPRSKGREESSRE